MSSTKCRRWLWRIPFFILGFVVLRSLLAMWLWNALIPELFHGPTLTFLQALGLVVLAKVILGGGFRPGGGGGRFGPPWARFQNMSPEERLKLREELRNRCSQQKGDQP